MRMRLMRFPRLIDEDVGKVESRDRGNWMD